MGSFGLLCAVSSTQPQWIVVADSPFLPARGGGEQEHLGFVRAASAAGYLAALVIPADVNPAKYQRQDDLQGISRLVDPVPVVSVPRSRAAAILRFWKPYVVASRPPARDLASRLRKLAPGANGVVVFSYKSHAIGRRIAKELGIPVVLRQHNLEGVYHRSLAKGASFPRSWALLLEALRIEVSERCLERGRWLNGIADISDADAVVRRRRARVRVEHVRSFAFASDEVALTGGRGTVSRQSVVFLGALDVETNVEAVTWFTNEVWPQIRAAVPVAELLVVGRRPSSRLVEHLGAVDGAELHRDVPDPAAFIKNAAVAVNPARSGSGVNIKLLEYLRWGAAVVSTRKGAEGLHLREGVDLVVADGAAEFAELVVALIQDPERAARIGTNGAAAAVEFQDPRAGLRVLSLMLQR